MVSVFPPRIAEVRTQSVSWVGEILTTFYIEATAGNMHGLQLLLPALH